MIVASVLAAKGKELICVAPETPIGEVTRMLHANGIGAVLVMQGGVLLGILSERGIVRALALHPGGVRAMRADSAMKPFRCQTSPSAPIEEAMQTMTDHRVRYLPVMEEHRLVGLLSVGDIIRAKLGHSLSEVENLAAYITGGR